MRRSRNGSGAAPYTGDDDVTAGSTAGPAGPQTPDAADAADIEALLATLAQFRLAVSADLSAAAGALDAERPDIAADVVDGARSDLAELRARAVARRIDQLIPALATHPTAGGAPANDASHYPAAGTVPEPARSGNGRALRGVHWQAKVLAGALAAALAVVVVPQLGGSGHPARPAAAAADRAPDIRLVSSEFTAMRRTLQSAGATPAQVLAAGQRWERAVAETLPRASTDVITASRIVTLLRQQRTLLQTAPALRTAAKRAAALTLRSSSDGLLARLRGLADVQVLAVLPTVITALPPAPVATPKPTTTPGPGSTTAPGSVELPPVTGTSPDPAQPSPTTPIVPSRPPTLPVPLPTLPVPVPSVLDQLGGLLPHETTGTGTNASTTTSGVQQGSVSQSVAAALDLLGH